MFKVMIFQHALIQIVDCHSCIIIQRQIDGNDVFINVRTSTSPPFPSIETSCLYLQLCDSRNKTPLHTNPHFRNCNSKRSRSHVQSALNIFKIYTNEVYTILMTCMNSQSFRWYE